MDFSIAGSEFDPTKYGNLSLAEKRDLVFRLSKWSRGAKTLQAWRRKDLLEILSAELGKERKYTGVTKEKLVVNLLKTVFQKRTGAVDLPFSDHEDDEYQHQHQHHRHPPPPPSSSKRQRKMRNPSRIPIVGTSAGLVCYCQNAACSFCRRCTCCICYTYDDNKDPSLWLVCSEEDDSNNNSSNDDDGNDDNSSSSSCGASCHLECALHRAKTDGWFKCVSCGKLNDLLRCLRKQLLIAKQARRVDVLCHQIFLIHRLLAGTEKYQDVNQIVEEIVNKLEAEVGPLNRLPTTLTRGMAVHRLSCGSQIQKLCTLAIDCIDSNTAGDSSGGNIAHHVAVRSIGSGIKIFGNILLNSMFGGEDRKESELRFDGKYFVTLQDRDWYWKAFLPEGADRNHPACNPFGPNGVSLSGLPFPKSLITVAGLDLTCDWQLEYALGLKKAKQDIKLLYLKQATIGFYLLPNNDHFFVLMEEINKFVNSDC